MKRSVQACKYIISDFVASSVVWLLFNVIRYQEIAVYEGFGDVWSFLTHSTSLWGQLLVPFFWIALFWLSGYYNKPFGKSRITELFSTFVTVSTGVVSLFFLLILNDLPRSYQIYYDVFFALWSLQFLGVYLPRLWITQAGKQKIKRGEWALRVLIIGTGERAQRIAADLTRLGYRIIGEVATQEMERLPERFEREPADELVVALEEDEQQQLQPIIYSLYKYKCPIKIWADKSTPLSRLKIKTVEDVPLIDLTDNHFLPVEQNVKWLMDKVISFVALVVLSPLFGYIAWRVKRDSKGPVFLRQERIGYMGKPFLICKFRTMYVDAEREGPLLSSEDDPRITPFGHVMRKYRLDELPQFWNVLKGDMSLVGPRPERRYFIDQIVQKAPFYYLLHNVRPGITSLGMVKYGYAGNVAQMIERLEYDMLYYENMSLMLDLTILIYTVRTVFTGKGV